MEASNWTSWTSSFPHQTNSLSSSPSDATWPPDRAAARSRACPQELPRRVAACHRRHATRRWSGSLQAIGVRHPAARHPPAHHRRHAPPDARAARGRRLLLGAGGHACQRRSKRMTTAPSCRRRGPSDSSGPMAGPKVLPTFQACQHAEAARRPLPKCPNWKSRPTASWSAKTLTPGSRRLVARPAPSSPHRPQRLSARAAWARSPGSGLCLDSGSAPGRIGTGRPAGLSPPPGRSCLQARR